jgi:hypothetical protein
MGKSQWVLARLKLSTYMHIPSTHPQLMRENILFVVANYLCLHLCPIFLKRDFICVVKFLEVKKSLILFVFYIDLFFIFRSIVSLVTLPCLNGVKRRPQF